MISPSRRRRTSRLPADAAFQTHLRLARRRELNRRLVRASLLAVMMAAVLLVTPVSGVWHALLTVLAFTLGAVLPARGAQAEALEEIRAHAGYSYDTALDLLAAEGDAANRDPYGFAAAVMQRARLVMRGFQPKQQAAWWLPATLMALTLLLLPSLLPSSGLLGGGSGPSGTGSPATAPGLEETISEPEGEEEVEAEPQPEAPGRVSDDSDPDGADTPPDGELAPPPPDDGSGQAPLARYLESLRERPAAAGGAETQGSAQPVQETPGESVADGERTTAVQTAAGRPEDATTPSDEAGRQEDAAGETAADGDRSGATRAQEGDDNAASQDGSDGQGQAGATPDQSGPQRGDDQALTEDDGAAPGAGDQRSDAEREAGGEDGAGSSGEQSASGDGSNDAGRGGAEAAGEPTAIELSSGAPELLDGQLLDGPETSAGTVRLPGSDEVQLPSGTAVAPYRSAAEEALTEGDLPLDYQQIIRRYFQ